MSAQIIERFFSIFDQIEFYVDINEKKNTKNIVECRLVSFGKKVLFPSLISILKSLFFFSKATFSHQFISNRVIFNIVKYHYHNSPYFITCLCPCVIGVDETMNISKTAYFLITGRYQIIIWLFWLQKNYAINKHLLKQNVLFF